MARLIRSVLAPAEACNRMYNALRKLYSDLVAIRDERNRPKRIELFSKVLEDDKLVDDAYAILRYSILKNLLLHLENSSNLAKKDSNYLNEAIDSAVKSLAFFEASRKSEHESMRKCHFLRGQSDHLKRVAGRMEKDLRNVLKQKIREVQKKQQTVLSRAELKKQMNVVRGKKQQQIPTRKAA